jgi:hypothetical protein
MKKKQLIIISIILGLIFLLCWLVAAILFIKNLRGLAEKNIEPAVVDMKLCDDDASDLCIVNFGANNLNRMVINFKLPDEDFPAFYLKAANRESVGVYSCEVTEAVPTSAYCTGVRTPLGETIDIEVYSTYGDKLIGRGTFLVSAIALATPISQPTITPGGEEMSEPFSTPEGDVFSNQGESTQEVTPTPSETSTPEVTLTKNKSTPTKRPTASYPYP